MVVKLSFKEMYNLIEQTKEPILGVDIFSASGGKLENVDIIDLSSLFKKIKNWTSLVKESQFELLKILDSYPNKEKFKYKIVFLDKKKFEKRQELLNLNNQMK